MFSRFACLWIFLASAAAYNYEDLIVAVGDQLEILHDGSQTRLLKLESFNASVLVALTFDPSTQTLFFSDKRHHRAHVFSVNFDGIKTSGEVHDLVERGSNQSVESLAFDPVDKALFWTDGLKQSIHRIALDREIPHVSENYTNEIVHLLPGDKPRGLVLDQCNRYMYWTNWNIDRPSIERSHLNGSFREIIVREGLFMPHGLGIDINEQMIYWANNLRHGTFKIERSAVDGSGRQLIYEGKGHELRGQFIFGLTVGKDHLYWTDWDQKTLWSLPKEGSPEKPTVIRRYQHKPMSIVLLHPTPVACHSPSKLDTNQVMRPTTQDGYSLNPTTQDGYSLNPTTQDGYSLNPTTHGETTHSQELTTALIETEAELCSGYCFNQGSCFFVDGDLRCSCVGDFSGDRCETDVRKENETASGSCEVSFELAASNSTVFAALIALSATCIILTLSVIFLSFRLRSLSETRPRLKRRILRQEKNYQPRERVINIEDCCNMNICETPCTEPPSGASLPGQTSDRIKLLNCQF